MNNIEEAFKRGWSKADEEGLVGQRVATGLEAAMPLLRKKIAREIEVLWFEADGKDDDYDYDEAYRHGLLDALIHVLEGDK